MFADIASFQAFRAFMKIYDEGRLTLYFWMSLDSSEVSFIRSGVIPLNIEWYRRRVSEEVNYRVSELTSTPSGL